VIFAVIEISLCRPYTWLYTGQFSPFIFAVVLLRYNFKCLFKRFANFVKSLVGIAEIWRFLIRYNCRQSVKSLPRHGRFSIFQNDGRPKCYFFNFKISHFVMSTCVTLPNYMYVQIAKAVAEICPLIRFSKRRPSAILDLLCACLDHTRSAFWWSLSLC